MLDKLTDTGTIERWWPTLYEPETAAFGGPAGTDAVHDLFCADSAGVLDYLRQDAPALGRRELSILLLSGLMLAICVATVSVDAPRWLWTLLVGALVTGVLRLLETTYPHPLTKASAESEQQR